VLKENNIELIHSDICGRFQTHIHIGCTYFITFIDDKLRYTTIYLLKHKLEAFEKFHHFKKQEEIQTHKKIKILQLDNGDEYKSNDFNNFCQDHGITRQFTIPYSPYQMVSMKGKIKL
jgi:transposase InsO family protein